MKRILLISSSAGHRNALSALLAGRGYAVTAEADGSSGLSVLQRGAAIDLIISDFSLSDMDIAGFFAALRRIAAAPRPVILMSDQVNVLDYLNALSLGAFELFFRPVQPPEFFRILNVAIRQGSPHPNRFRDRVHRSAVHPASRRFKKRAAACEQCRVFDYE